MVLWHNLDCSSQLKRNEITNVNNLKCLRNTIEYTENQYILYVFDMVKSNMSKFSAIHFRSNFTSMHTNFGYQLRSNPVQSAEYQENPYYLVAYGNLIVSQMFCLLMEEIPLFIYRLSLDCIEYRLHNPQYRKNNISWNLSVTLLWFDTSHIRYFWFCFLSIFMPVSAN